MKVFISGKIGEEVISEATRQKFARAAEMLEAKGHLTFNPCDEQWVENLHRCYEKDKPAWMSVDGKFTTFYGYALLRDLMVLSTCDAVYMRHDWRRSPGAMAEYHFAVATGKQMFLQLHGDAAEYLRKKFFDNMEAIMEAENWQETPWNEALNLFIQKHLDEVWLP